MPTVIAMISPREADTKRALGGALVDAVVESFQIPATRVNVYIQEYAPENRHGGQIDATIMVHALPRTVELKRALVRNAAQAAAAQLGIELDRVNVIISDTLVENTGVGGTLAADRQGATTPQR